MKKNTNAHHIQQKYCELETLRVFRVLTNQVFGKLIINQERPMSNQNFAPSMVDSHMDSPGGDSLDLREHMVGILFSRSKLTHLQKQVRLTSSKLLQKSYFSFIPRSSFTSFTRSKKKLKSRAKNGNCMSAQSAQVTSLKAR